MQGHKPVPTDWIVAEPWLWTFPDYTLTVDVPAEVTSVEIDPAGRMPDMNRLNNRDPLPTRWRFLQPPQPSWFEYGIGYRPLVQYADDFGFGAGLQLRGRYLFGQKQLQGMVKLWPEVLFSSGDEPSIPGLAARGSGLVESTESSVLDGIDYALSYTDDLRAIGPRATFSLSAIKHLGLLENRIEVEKPFGPPIAAYTGDSQQHVSVQLIHQHNPTDRVFGAIDQPFGPDESLQVDRFNPFAQEHMLSAQAKYSVNTDRDWLSLGLEVGGSIAGSRVPFVAARPAGPQSATHLYLSAGKHARLGLFEGKATFQFGLGPRNLATHKLFRLGGGSYEALWRNDAHRSIAATLADPAGDAHFVGLGSSGPVAYLVNDIDFPDPAARTLNNPLVGTRMIAGRLSLQTPQFAGSSFVRPLRFGLFSGIGDAWSNGAFLAGFDTDNLLADAGVSIDYDVTELNALDRWTAQSDVLSNLQITARFPIWASNPEFTQAEDDEFAFRWLIGIEVGL
jgi:hypothetical protein